MLLVKNEILDEGTCRHFIVHVDLIVLEAIFRCVVQWEQKQPLLILK